jgi:hypothetical protein
VSSSSRRVHALATTTTAPVARTNHQNTRDISLLKHMFFIFVVFILGWTPMYAVPMTSLSITMTTFVLQCAQLLPVISAIIIAVDLFIYNHDVRKYLKDKFLKFFT